MRTLRLFFASFAVKDLNRKGRKGLAKGAKVGLAWLLCLAALPVCRAQSAVPKEQIDQIFAGLKSDGGPGGAVLVIRNGSIIFERGYGVADLRSRRKIDAHTNFRLASCTKQFTAMAVMLLARDGKLRYQDRLTDIFPDFPEYGKGITIRNLLNHTSGLLDYEDLMVKPAAGNPPENIPQIKDAGVLRAAERTEDHEISSRHQVGLQQLRLCRAGHGGGKSVGPALWRFSSRPHLRPPGHEADRGLREGQEYSGPPRLWPYS